MSTISKSNRRIKRSDNDANSKNMFVIVTMKQTVHRRGTVSFIVLAVVTTGKLDLQRTEARPIRVRSEGECALIASCPTVAGTLVANDVRVIVAILDSVEKTKSVTGDQMNLSGRGNLVQRHPNRSKNGLEKSGEKN